MSTKCTICGKAPQSGNTVSHSHRTTKRRWLPNLQKVKIAPNGGSPKRVRVCTACIRAGKVQKIV